MTPDGGNAFRQSLKTLTQQRLCDASSVVQCVSELFWQFSELSIVYHQSAAKGHLPYKGVVNVAHRAKRSILITDKGHVVTWIIRKAVSKEPASEQVANNWLSL